MDMQELSKLSKATRIHTNYSSVYNSEGTPTSAEVELKFMIEGSENVGESVQLVSDFMKQIY